ncbi:MAG: T9SS type A sorting domain-containing protein, partial [Bacteroidales bacterium]|nr:T9SS type A sorting domain-containing protein [Bacteroidales bacterium]
AEDGSSEIYIVTVIIDPNTEKKILTYSFQGITPPATGTINNSTQTIQVNIPHSVSRLGLVATFTLSDHATAFVGGVQQVSGTTANDFDVVVTYVIQAQDGSTTSWQVTVTNNPVQTAKQITAYSFQALNPPVTGTIDQTALTIDLEVPYGTDVTALVATFTNSYLSTVDIGGVAQVSGTTANDFTNPVVYTVTAEDGSSNDYTVTVTIHPASSAKDMLTFLFEAAKNAALTADAIGVIDQTARTINVEVPDETDRTALVATFTSSPITTVRIRSLGIQQSGVTINDFTNPVVYEVYAQDGTMKDYLVSVYESVDVTPPVVSNAAQTVSNLQGMFVVVRSNEDDGKVYIIKTGVAQSSVAQLEAAVAAGNGRSAYVTAADTDIPISTFNMTPGVYYAYAIDAAGNMSAKGTNAITIQDQMPPTVSVDAQTISNAPFNVVNIRSSDASGFVYLIIEGVPQANKAQLDAAVVANQGAKNFVIAANTDAPVSIAGLVPGNYHAYAVDMSNNMSNASANVVVITQASRLKSIMAYSFNQLNPPAIGQITGTEISVVVPVGTDVTNLVASFTLSPLSKAFVGLVEQVSGVSPNNFTTPVIYTVEAEDASTLDYQVTVSFNTGINDLPWSHQIRVYPNPFQDELITETPEPADRIEVVNVMGQVIDLINKPDATLIRWHTTSWEKGLYLIRVYKDGQLTAMEKLIK